MLIRGSARQTAIGTAALLSTLALSGGCGGGAEPPLGPPDAGALDPDASPPEPDAAAPDREATDRAPDPQDAAVDGPAPYPRPAYQRLAETGFFAEGGAAPAPDLEAFEPAYPLWSDGTSKRRWIRLPPGTRVDTTEMDHWQFPVGTKLWKEFSREGVLYETRLVERYGPGREDYWMGAFVWNMEGTDAFYAVDGTMDIHGSTHDAPAAKVCGACHRGDKGRVLGLSSLQLGQPAAADRPGLTLARLVERALLSAPPADGTSAYPVPGDAPTAAALGYLHANCGHCHNENGSSWPDTQMVLRLRVGEQIAGESELARSVVGGKLQSYRHPTLTDRVVPGDPGRSGLLERMKIRGSKDQMPSLATEVIDPSGIEVVTRWIAGLAP